MIDGLGKIGWGMHGVLVRLAGWLARSDMIWWEDRSVTR